MFDEIAKMIAGQGFDILSKCTDRPWGGFFVINEDQAQKFADVYFEKSDIGRLRISEKFTPKILLVKPGKRLSWQYHNRRAEIWRVIKGEVGVVRSDNDIEGIPEILTEGSVIILKQGERHRLIGLKEPAVVAEIWRHTVAGEPSDEQDIVRVSDDFGR